MERGPCTIHFTFPRYIDITYFSVGYDFGIAFYHVRYIMFLDVHTTSFTSIYCILIVSVGRNCCRGLLYLMSR